MMSNLVPQLLLAIGFLAFIVSSIVEVIKNVGVLSKIPTDVVVIILSLVGTMVAFLGWADYTGVTLVWYWYAGALVTGFLVAFVAMYGWEKFNELWKRFNLDD